MAFPCLPPGCALCLIYERHKVELNPLISLAEEVLTTDSHCPSFVEEPLLAVRRHRRQIGLKMRALNSGVPAVALDELADQLCSSDN